MTKSNKKISFLVPDINSPVIGPVTVLARILASRYDVEIVGPDFGQGVCPMYRDAFPYKAVPTSRLYRLPDYFVESRALGRAVTGDIIIAVKAYADTVNVALREKKRRGARVLVYLDEWDGALMRMRSPWGRLRRWAAHWHHPLDDCYYPLVERFIRKADGVLSTNTFLQRRFGGFIVHMGVDTHQFSPLPVAEAEALRNKHGLDAYKCIVFGGVVRPHKGIELILSALARLANPAYRFVVVGPENEHVRLLKKDPAYGPYVITLGSQPKDRMPSFLGIADLIVLPLNDNLLAQSQTPCKIFEAMAMARPIIASAVSDLPLILEGCGRVVPPGRVEPLAEAIDHVLSHPKDAEAMGQAARERCIQLYSKSVTEKNLFYIIDAIQEQRMPL
jgi:glycosyltransferase involved in cell wall biosynthesis